MSVEWGAAVRGERGSERYCFGRLTGASHDFCVSCIGRFVSLDPSARVLRVNYKRKNGLLPFTRLNYGMAKVSHTTDHVRRTRAFFTTSNCGKRFAAASFFGFSSTSHCRLVLVRSIVRRVDGGRRFFHYLSPLLTGKNVVF